jgi:PAB-dependent poly(A)-specific ribonuclease subunit 3
LTSSSSRDSLPAHAPGGASTTPQKQTRNYRRTKSNKAANSKWSEAAPQPKPPQNAVHTPSNGTTHPAQARLMATAFGGPSGDSRRGVSSPRPKGRGMDEPAWRHVLQLTSE